MDPGESLETEIAHLRRQLAEKEAQWIREQNEKRIDPKPQQKHLNADQISRYGRQLIMPDIGVEGSLGNRRVGKVDNADPPIGQLRLVNTSVLLVGAGGLSSSAAMYLAGAGIGKRESNNV